MIETQLPQAATRQCPDAARATTSDAAPAVRARHARRPKRSALLGAVVVAAGVPICVLTLLWRDLASTFWYNEVWRAYYIAKPAHWWDVPTNNNAPFPAGWYVLERASTALFGSTELVMRLPTAAFLPITCVLLLFLARRFMPTGGAVIVALVGGLTGTLVNYAVQLSEYQIDAAAAVAVLLLHEVAGDGPQNQWRRYRIYACYAGIAVACLMSTPAVMVAAPVLLLDAFRAFRARSIGPRIVSAVGAGVIALVHLTLYVAPQNALTKGQGWAQQFMPHHGLAKQVAFVWDGLRGFVTGTFTGSDTPTMSYLLSPRLSWIPSVVLAALLLCGIVAAARSEGGRTLLAAVGGALALTLAASYVRYWPFGFVRTNFYLIPLLILLAGVGAAAAVRVLRVRLSQHGRTASVGRSAASVGALVAVVALVAVGVGTGATYEVSSLGHIRDMTSVPLYGKGIVKAVADVKSHADPGAALVVSGSMVTQAWEYYQYEYAGVATRVGHQIPMSHAEFTAGYGSPAISRLIRRTEPSQVFLYVAFGSNGSDLADDMSAIAAGGEACGAVAQESFDDSGLLIVEKCAPPSTGAHLSA